MVHIPLESIVVFYQCLLILSILLPLTVTLFTDLKNDYATFWKISMAVFVTTLVWVVLSLVVLCNLEA